MVRGTTKSHKRREVPSRCSSPEELRAHVGRREPNDLVFAGIRNGAPLRVSTFRLQFGVAAEAIGHASATMTLDTYGHLFEDRLDEVGDALARARTAAQERRQGLNALPRVVGVLPKPDLEQIPKGPSQRFRWS